MFYQTALPTWSGVASAITDALQSVRPWKQQTTVDVPPLLQQLSDEACMARYQKGDGAAFRVLYSRYRDRVHRYVLRLAGAKAEAEEVFQDVWLSVIHGAQRYPPSVSFAAWLFSIAHRRAVDRWRGLARHAPDAQYAVDDEALLDSDTHVDADTPERQAYNDDLREALLRAVEQLPLPQREAFLLRAEGELSVEEIASITGVNRETAKSRLRYAQRSLRTSLQAWR
jgi:RNA polymerase sigma-70 factor (ECF subfamily)